jgi:transcription initiation factor TFIID subunit TAF12
MLVGGMSMGRRSAQRQQQQQQQAYQQGQQAQQQAQTQQAQQQQAQQAQAAAAPPKDTTAELMKLADLHKAGALTDQEFEAAKKKILS